jgi:hypothetical protein
MITLKDFMETVNYRITEGSEYCWNCYGNNAYSLDSWNGDNDSGYSAGIVFDTVTQTVYEMNVSDYKNQRAYRLINPAYKAVYLSESTRRGADSDQAWDDINYIDLESDEDMLAKTRAIFDGVDYDTRVSVPIDLDNETMLSIALAAHERDITLNQYVEYLLSQAIAKHKEENNG